MSQRLVVLNIVFLAAVVIGVVRLRQDAIAFASEHRVEQIQAESDKAVPKAVQAAATPARQEWADIASRNPFSFDRNDVTLVVTQPAAQQPKRPKPILLGTMMLGKDWIAMLSPGDSAGRGSQSVRTGESFDGWTLLEIHDKSVLMQSDNIKESVILNDPTAPVARLAEKTAAAPQAPPPPTNANTAAAPEQPLPQGRTLQAGPNPLPPGPNGKKQILVVTPFGNKVMDDPNQ
jgi:hypothetical protein